MCIVYDVVTCLRCFFLDILKIHQVFLTYMTKTYFYVWSYVCICLQSSNSVANVIVGFPRSQEKTSSLFIGTNTAPGLQSQLHMQENLSDRPVLLL